MRGFLTENLGLKLLAVTLAAMLELYFYSPDNLLSAELNVPVEVRNVPPSRMIVNPPDADKSLFAKVKVRGPAPLIEQLKGQLHKFVVAFPSGTRDSHMAVLDPASLGFGSSVEILNVEPRSVEFGFERVVKKELFVVLNQSGAPAPGYRLDSVKVFPETVYARGPRSELEGRGVIETEAIDISGAKGNRRIEVALIDKGPRTALGVNVVTVEVKVRPLQSQTSFRNVNVKLLAPRGVAATVEPSRVNVTFRGPENVIKKMSPKDFSLYADTHGLPEGGHEVEVTGKFPKGVGIAETKPATVRVTIAKTAAK